VLRNKIRGLFVLPNRHYVSAVDEIRSPTDDAFVAEGDAPEAFPTFGVPSGDGGRISYYYIIKLIANELLNSGESF